MGVSKGSGLSQREERIVAIQLISIKKVDVARKMPRNSNVATLTERRIAHRQRQLEQGRLGHQHHHHQQRRQLTW